MSEQVWLDAANAVVRAGMVPLPVTGTIIELLQTIMTPEQAAFLPAFDGPMNMGQLRTKTGWEEPALALMLGGLMDNGIVTGTKSRGSGAMVYRLMGPFPGMFEFTMMRGETGEKQKKLARLFDRMFDELSGMVRANYDAIIPAFRAFPPVARVVPLRTEIDPAKDAVLPADEVNRIVEKFDTIAVTTCYCRHEKELLGEPCAVTSNKENCLMFGKIARFAMEHRFARPVTKEDAYPHPARVRGGRPGAQGLSREPGPGPGGGSDLQLLQVLLRHLPDVLQGSGPAPQLRVVPRGRGRGSMLGLRRVHRKVPHGSDRGAG